MTATPRIIISRPISVKLKWPLLAAINLKCQLSPPPLILVGGAGGERWLRGWRRLAFLAKKFII